MICGECRDTDDLLARGLCSPCYQRLRLSGALDVEVQGAPPERVAELKAMQTDGTLGDHCRDLLTKALNHI